MCTIISMKKIIEKILLLLIQHFHWVNIPIFFRPLDEWHERILLLELENISEEWKPSWTWRNVHKTSISTYRPSKSYNPAEIWFGHCKLLETNLEVSILHLTVQLQLRTLMYYFILYYLLKCTIVSIIKMVQAKHMSSRVPAHGKLYGLMFFL